MLSRGSEVWASKSHLLGVVNSTHIKVLTFAYLGGCQLNKALAQ